MCNAGVLAAIYKIQKKLEEAEAIETRILERTKCVLAEEAAETGKSAGVLGWMWWHMGRCDEAIDLMEECVRLRRKIYGEDQFSTICGIAKLAFWKQSLTRPRR